MVPPRATITHSSSHLGHAHFSEGFPPKRISVTSLTALHPTPYWDPDIPVCAHLPKPRGTRGAPQVPNRNSTTMEKCISLRRLDRRPKQASPPLPHTHSEYTGRLPSKGCHPSPRRPARPWAQGSFTLPEAEPQHETQHAQLCAEVSLVEAGPTLCGQLRPRAGSESPSDGGGRQAAAAQAMRKGRKLGGGGRPPPDTGFSSALLQCK